MACRPLLRSCAITIRAYSLCSEARAGIMRQVVSYIRVSTGKQGKSGLGIEAQRDAIARFAAAEGCEVVGEFVEVETGKGADALDRRPKLAAALAQARKGKAAVVVAKLVPPVARCGVHLRPDGAAGAVHRGRAWRRRGPVHAAHLCRAGREGAGHDRRADPRGAGAEEGTGGFAGEPHQSGRRRRRRALRRTGQRRMPSRRTCFRSCGRYRRAVPPRRAPSPRR